MPKITRQKRNKNQRQAAQSLVALGKGPYLPSSAKRIERTVARYSGSSVTQATSSGYSWMTFDSSRFTESSPWTVLSNLYLFVRPIGLKVTVTACRATSSSDNPVVCFAPTPDGNPVGSAAMNLNTFEAPTGRTFTLGPGQEVSYVFKPYALQSLYAPVSNGYASMICPRVNVNSLPRIYFGDILLLTPGVTLTTTANYIQIKAEYVFEFDTIDPANIQ